MKMYLMYLIALTLDDGRALFFSFFFPLDGAVRKVDQLLQNHLACADDFIAEGVVQ